MPYYPDGSPMSPRPVRTTRRSAQRREARTERGPEKGAPQKLSWRQWAYKWRTALGVSAAALMAAVYYYKYGARHYDALVQYAQQRGVTMTPRAAAQGEAMAEASPKVVKALVEKEPRAPLQLQVSSPGDATSPFNGTYLRDGDVYDFPKYRKVGTNYYLYRSPTKGIWTFTHNGMKGVEALKGRITTTTKSESPVGQAFVVHDSTTNEWIPALHFQVKQLF